MLNARSNIFEAMNGSKKAIAIADLLDANHITAEDARQIDAALWPRLAVKAKVCKPSPTTIGHIISLLEAREAARAEAHRRLTAGAA